MKTLDLRITLLFALALICSIFPLPEWLNTFRPPWVLLALLMLQFYLPHRFNALVVIFTGLLLDALLATVIGEHVFALAFSCLAASQKARRFYCFTMTQQMALVGGFCLLYQLALLLIDAFLGGRLLFMQAFGSVFTSVLLWPWCRLLISEYFALSAINEG